MSKNIIIVFSVIAMVLLINWLMSREETSVITEEPSETQETKQPFLPSTSAPIKQNNASGVQTETHTPTQGNTIQNPLSDESFKAQIVNIAYAYNQTAQFPIGSQPITNPDDVRDLRPFEETETTTPFSTEDGPVNLSAAVDKYQYFKGETIELQLQLSGALSNRFISPEAFIINPGDRNKTLTPININPVGASNTKFLGILDTSLLANDTFAQEMLIEITVHIDNEPLFTTLSFRYNEASAKIIGTGDARPNGPNLDIPLKVDVAQKGYYFVRAVLQDQRTNKPLIALQQEGKMRKGRDEIILQAHIQALKASGSEGPYLLRSFDIYRGAEQGEQFDTFGTSTEKQYTVNGFPFSQYIDEPHQDSLAQERAEFLLKLGTQEDQ
jgi:hypothetical protein